ARLLRVSLPVRPSLDCTCGWGLDITPGAVRRVPTRWTWRHEGSLPEGRLRQHHHSRGVDETPLLLAGGGDAIREGDDLASSRAHRSAHPSPARASVGRDRGGAGAVRGPGRLRFTL